MGYQSEMLVFIALVGILTAIILPPLQATTTHFGWPGLIVLPATIISAVVGTFASM